MVIYFFYLAATIAINKYLNKNINKQKNVIMFVLLVSFKNIVLRGSIYQ